MMYIEEADRRSIGPRDVRELQKCLDVHVQNERGREEEVFPIVELSRERARLVSTEDENEVEEGRRDAVPFRKGGGRISAVAADFPSFHYKPNEADARISIPPPSTWAAFFAFG